jgi:polyhydroxybutyrate depolymerase
MGRALAALLLLLGACSHTTRRNEATPIDGSGGRGSDGAEAPGATDTLTLTVRGRARTVIVHSPGGAPGPLALVLNLHGSGSNAADEETFSGMDRVADARGFVAAYPQGAVALGGGFAWNVPGQPLIGGQPVPADAADDVEFLGQAIALIEQRYPIDGKRVYAAGMSGGGRMASQLACDLSATLAAVAPVAGLRFPSPCPGQRAVPIVAFHGTADTVNPYDGNGEAYWTYSVPTAAQQWALHDGCRPTPTLSRPAPGVSLTAYDGCNGAASVQLYTVDGAGHEWPGAPQQSTAIDATSVMWAFFAQQRLP